jgi:hypothetical protein
MRSKYGTPYGRLHRRDVRVVNRRSNMMVGATYADSVTLDSSATSSEDDDEASCPVFEIMELDNPTDKDGIMFFFAKEDE